MGLTQAQKLQLWQEGWTKVPGVVARHMIDAALRAISHSVGEGLDPEKGDYLQEVRYGIFFRMHYPAEPRNWESLANMWQHWPGLADVIDKS